MKLYSGNNDYKLYYGNMLDLLEVIDKETIDSIITDPPYELNFMSKNWDNSGIAFQKETWKKCFEVLKPGGYLLAFGGSRTFHRIACAIEDAGFEIRDTICYMYGSGFPKSMNLSKQFEKKNDKENALKWKNWGTCLKPSFEPIIVARKPFKGSLVDNVIEYGVGGINIDECRVEFSKNEPDNRVGKIDVQKGAMKNPWGAKSDYDNTTYKSNGRFPANTILTYDETDFDEVCGGFPNTKSQIRVSEDKDIKQNTWSLGRIGITPRGHNDSGSASRYFYCAKASKKDRDEGLEEFESKKTGSMMANINGNMQLGGASLKGNPKEIQPKKNIHPTVKPTELMQYLIRLVSPNGATILDPFNGSGSTGKAVMYENLERNKNYKYIGIELTEEYLPIAQARIEYICGKNKEKNDEELQTTIFDFIK